MSSLLPAPAQKSTALISVKLHHFHCLHLDYFFNVCFALSQAPAKATVKRCMKNGEAREFHEVLSFLKKFSSFFLSVLYLFGKLINNLFSSVNKM